MRFKLKSLLTIEHFSNPVKLRIFGQNCVFRSKALNQLSACSAHVAGASSNHLQLIWLVLRRATIINDSKMCLRLLERLSLLYSTTRRARQTVSHLKLCVGHVHMYMNWRARGDDESSSGVGNPTVEQF